MRIFEVERNGLCPCGSGRKFKKCCQEKVEETVRRIGRVVGLGDCTAEGREIVETLAFICGMRAEEDASVPEPEMLGRLLQEAWDEEERLRDRGDEVGLKALMERFQELLGEKPYLRHLRFPVWSIDDDEAFDITEYLDTTSGYMLVRRSIELIRLSLLYDDYRQDELMLLLTGLGWLVADGRRELFWRPVLIMTRNDLVSAAREVTEISEKYGDSDAERKDYYVGMEAVFNRYPSYKKMLAERLMEEMKPAMSAVLQGEIRLEVPLYSVLGGIYATISGLAGSFENLLSQRQAPEILLSLLEESLLDAGEYEFFLPEAINSIGDRAKEVRDGALEISLRKLMLYLSLMYDDKRYAFLEYLYLMKTRSFLAGLPLALPEAGVEFKDVKDLCDENLIEKYAAYLESRNLVEEAGHVWDVYRSFGVRAREKIAGGIKGLDAFTRFFAEKEMPSES